MSFFNRRRQTSEEKNAAANANSNGAGDKAPGMMSEKERQAAAIMRGEGMGMKGPGAGAQGPGRRGNGDARPYPPAARQSTAPPSGILQSTTPPSAQANPNPNANPNASASYPAEKPTAASAVAAASTASGPANASPTSSAPSSHSHSSSSNPNPNPSSTRGPVYPWTARRLEAKPILYLSGPAPGQPIPAGQPAPSGPKSPLPFPRYGHSLPLTSSTTGDLFLFGGLVADSVRNDLYMINARELSATLVETVGEVPAPRVGHKSALVSSVLIVWGGDTKKEEGDGLDEMLYLLNLNTREWHRVQTSGAGPSGRYGHSVALCDSKFLVFGGQVDGKFMGDLWSFDLNTLKTGPQWECLFLPPPSSDPLNPTNGKEKGPISDGPYGQGAGPAPRTGHCMAVHGGKVYVFGGTDGGFHYNDVWAFDVRTRRWDELKTIGYIPSPREGHACALVDDVMYVFGGRGVNGRDLDDLAAFKIGTSRWFIFQNMGPAPTGRSGHAMASFGQRVFVLGGESSAIAPSPSDPSGFSPSQAALKPPPADLIHVLDTKHIKYPDPSKPPNIPVSAAPLANGSRPAAQPTSQPPQPSQAPPGYAARVDPVGAARSKSPERAVSASPPGSRNGMVSGSQAVVGMNGQGGRMQSFAAPLQASPAQQLNGSVVANGNGNGPARPVQQRAMSPEGAGAYHPQPPQPQQQDMQARTVSPLGAMAGAAYLTLRNTSPTPPPFPAMQAFPQMGQPPSQPSSILSSGPGGRRSVTPTMAARSPTPTTSTVRAPSVVRSPSPAEALRTSVRAATPQRPLSPPAPVVAAQPMMANVAPAAPAPAPAPVQDSKELEALRRREQWYREVVERAMLAGFVPPTSPENIDLQDKEKDSPNVDGDVWQEVWTLKQDRARMQQTLVDAAQAASDKCSQAERERAAAVQEAAYYRAKLGAHEAGSGAELAKVERERAAELERHVAQLEADKVMAERKLAEVSHQSEMHRRLREQAEARAEEAARRAEEAEENHDRLGREHVDLQSRHATVDSQLREHADKVVGLSAQVQQREMEHTRLLNQLEDLRREQHEHRQALEQAQFALEAAGSRDAETQEQLARSVEQVGMLESELSQLRAEYEAKITENEMAARRLEDAENAWAKSREEADALRAFTTGKLGELLDSQKSRMEDVGDRGTEGDAERIRVMEMEAASLRNMLKEAGKRVDEVQTSLADHRRRELGTSADQMSLRSQLNSLRSQLARAVEDAGYLRSQLAEKDAALLDRSRQAAEADVRTGMLRSYLAENGIAIEEDALNGKLDGSVEARIRDLENRLAERVRLHEDAERSLRATRQRKDDAETQAATLSRQLDRMRTTQSPTVRGSDEEGSPPGTAEGRLVQAEQKRAEAEQQAREVQTRLSQLERDYSIAVHYVKGTEKMLRRLKDQVAKEKSISAALQSELDSSRGVSGSVAGARTRAANGRSTPLSDTDGGHSENMKAQMLEVQRNMHRLANENQDLQRRLEALQLELDQYRDRLIASQRESDNRLSQIEELEAETERLEAALQVARGNNDETIAEQLGRENTTLKRENEMLHHKIGLLLDDQTYAGAGDRPLSTSSHQDSASSSENAIALESLSHELDDWQRRLASRPLSNDFDADPYRTHGLRV
ncbi:hypothetical protein CALCODRAFT_487056 [Calocera cornea HHB12733]|uniref:Galactose oxidase n=1 Tax=Calocera cornea HHB12733 TaxID=1353952 RepID=A0A165DD11_9BASI|nr:hypothetical protein CALCODRAFT_487056 [Calocera cornea HHB12733]